MGSTSSAGWLAMAARLEAELEERGSAGAEQRIAVTELPPSLPTRYTADQGEGDVFTQGSDFGTTLPVTQPPMSHCHVPGVQITHV